MSLRPPAVRGIYRRWLRLYVPLATLVLGASALVGFLLGSAVPVEALPTPQNPGQNGIFPPLTTVDIAVNNLVAMTVILLGAVSLGLVSLFGLVLNGLLIGVIVGIAVQELSPLVVLALLVPHGILEIPALLVAAAIGLRFARLTVRYIRGLEADLVTTRDLREAGWLVAVCAVLIVVAAYIEANLTIPFAEWVAGGDLPIAA
jgi:stage II sporulation protein M